VNATARMRAQCARAALSTEHERSADRADPSVESARSGVAESQSSRVPMRALREPFNA
jgi:hypothetical protein